MPHKQINLEYFIGRESPYSVAVWYLIPHVTFWCQKRFFISYIGVVCQYDQIV